jgi:hypothetical protein
MHGGADSQLFLETVGGKENGWRNRSKASDFEDPGASSRGVQGLGREPNLNRWQVLLPRV